MTAAKRTQLKKKVEAGQARNRAKTEHTTTIFDRAGEAAIEAKDKFTAFAKEHPIATVAGGLCGQQRRDRAAALVEDGADERAESLIAPHAKLITVGAEGAGAVARAPRAPAGPGPPRSQGARPGPAAVRVGVAAARGAPRAGGAASAAHSGAPAGDVPATAKDASKDAPKTESKAEKKKGARKVERLTLDEFIDRALVAAPAGLRRSRRPGRPPGERRTRVASSP